MNKFDEIKEFKKLLDEGIITLEEFNKKKSELLSMDSTQSEISESDSLNSIPHIQDSSNEENNKSKDGMEISKDNLTNTNDATKDSNAAVKHNQLPPKFIPNQEVTKESLSDTIKKKLDKFTKKQKVIFGSLMAIVLIFSFCLLTAKSPYEKQADYYIGKLKKIDSVETVNAVFCIRDEEFDKTTYAIFYRNNYGKDTAVFDSSGTYLGNGTNGGYYRDSSEESSNNIWAAYSAKDALEFFQSEFTEETYKPHMSKEFDNEDGVVYVEFNDFLGWF